jgi:hypothetical protein
MAEGEGRIGEERALVERIDRYFMDPTSFSALQ